MALWELCSITKMSTYQESTNAKGHLESTCMNPWCVCYINLCKQGFYINGTSVIQFIQPGHLLWVYWRKILPSHKSYCLSLEEKLKSISKLKLLFIIDCLLIITRSSVIIQIQLNLKSFYKLFKYSLVLLWTSLKLKQRFFNV